MAPDGTRLRDPVFSCGLSWLRAGPQGRYGSCREVGGKEVSQLGMESLTDFSNSNSRRSAHSGPKYLLREDRSADRWTGLIQLGRL